MKTEIHGSGSCSEISKARTLMLEEFARMIRSSRGALIGVVVNMAWILVLLFFPGQLNGAELKPEMVKAFDQYVQKSELSINAELRSDKPFLWIDSLSDADRAAAYAHLRNEGILVHPMAAGLEIPGGMIHDWIGVAFIPTPPWMTLWHKPRTMTPILGSILPRCRAQKFSSEMAMISRSPCYCRRRALWP